ncbi:MAG: arginine deiminase family protein [Gemmatimonadetes bacterium]|nr:arginine deiminase family protein [Gemmatimonadota bacterium]
MLSNEGDRLTRAVVSAPRNAYFDVGDLAANNINELPDRSRATRQMEQLTATLEAFGSEVVDVPELEGHPNCVFPRDVVLMTPEGFIRLRMGLETRRGEERWMARALEALGERCVGEIVPPGTVEGGDVILLGDIAFVGRSQRTNDEGVAQLSALLSPMGYEVRTAPVSEEYLHLGGQMSALGPSRVLHCRGVYPPGLFRGIETIEVHPCGPSAGNVICLGSGDVVANAAEEAETIRELERQGVTVQAIDLSEFHKGAGGPTCLILPVHRASIC